MGLGLFSYLRPLAAANAAVFVCRSRGLKCVSAPGRPGAPDVERLARASAVPTPRRAAARRAQKFSPLGLTKTRRSPILMLRRNPRRNPKGPQAMVKETETETETKSKSEITLLAQDGSEAESEEQAYGFDYKLLGNGKCHRWQWSEASEDERRMLAILGGKTLATNETSAIRNNKKLQGTPEGSVDAQFEALVERFGLVRSGTWVDRTREPGAPRIDKDKMADALADVLLADGKITQADWQSARDARRAKLDDETKSGSPPMTYMQFMRTNAKVAAAYAARMGKPQASVDDI